MSAKVYEGGKETENNGEPETYLDITINGVATQCILDTGCDYSIILLKRARNAPIRPTKTELFAANGSRIDVLGKATLAFYVNDGKTPLYADFLVTEDVEDIMLGFDWVRRNGCHWLFDRAMVVVQGQPIRLKSRPSAANVKRVYVRHTMTIPPHSQANVPVKLPLTSLSVVSDNWVVEAKEIRPELLMSRTLLPDRDDFAAVQLINLSKKRYKLNCGSYLGQADSCEVLGHAGEDLQHMGNSASAAEVSETTEVKTQCDGNVSLCLADAKVIRTSVIKFAAADTICDNFQSLYSTFSNNSQFRPKCRAISSNLDGIPIFDAKESLKNGSRAVLAGEGSILRTPNISDRSISFTMDSRSLPTLDGLTGPITPYNAWNSVNGLVSA